ncbi:MAG: hypothetical protein IKZ34_03610 [Alphaproteobacteria bacterium]|nr:hypothetical protein [Alphaproteobacteria bacterium]
MFGCLIALCTLSVSLTTARAEDYDIAIKSSQFDEILGDSNEDTTTASDSALAEKIRKQRAALNAQSAKEASTNKAKSSAASGKNDCDQKLRACMKSKCGEDYSKCSGDTDTTWGDKMDTCRRDTTCTGEEYRLFTAEIKADRDMNSKLSSYTSIIDCGDKYNDCIIKECGQTFTKCLGKSAGDKVVQKCSKIANQCKEQDSGLASRAMEVFANLRQEAEKLIIRDEKRLYELRDKMRNTCDRLGALFDERTLDCVYSVELYAGEDNTLLSSKKTYAGGTFNCHQDWFGVDVTTFKENAFRLTKSQTSASSAALGAGVGVGVGALTSGALDRAIDRSKSERALGQELCESTGGKWQKAINKCKCESTKSFDEETGCQTDDKKTEKEENKKSRDKQKEDKANDKNAKKELCEQAGKWVGAVCYCNDKTHSFDDVNGCTENANKKKRADNKAERQEQNELNKLKKNSQAEQEARDKKLCELNGKGKWKNGTCKCTTEGETYDKGSGICTSAHNTERKENTKEDQASIDRKKQLCDTYNGKWTGNTCDCGVGKDWDDKLNMCKNKFADMKIEAPEIKLSL